MSNTIWTPEYGTDIQRVLLWGQNVAERVTRLVLAKHQWYSTHCEAFWRDWFKNVYCLETADSFGLSVWAAILGLNTRLMVITEYPEQPDPNITYLFPDSARMVLKLQYLKLTCRPTVPLINEMLYKLFKNQGGAYVVDNFDMTYIQYTFDFDISDIASVATKLDLFPRPSTVGIKLDYPRPEWFGFSDGFTPFNTEVFHEDGVDGPYKPSIG